MVLSAIIIVLLGLNSPGQTPSATTSTTIAIPDSPSAGLSLDLEPIPAVGLSRPVLPSEPTVPGRSFAGMWAVLAAGMALLVTRARRVSAASSVVRDSLQDSLFSDVGSEDLSRIAAVIDSLEPLEVDALIASLSDRELGVWLRELDGWAGGFSRPEEEALFARLAATLGPAQLARLVNQGKSRQLIEATITSAPSRVRAELALALWSTMDPARGEWEHIIDLFESASPGDREATVARAVPGSVLIDLLSLQLDDPELAPGVRFDLLARFVDGAVVFMGPAVKAEIFVAGNRAVRDVERLRRVGDVKPVDVLSRLGALVRSDPGGVITRLNHDLDPHGDVFAGWIHDMIEADRLDELDVVLADLLGGTDRVAYYAERGEDPARPYPNAANLGYYVGAYSLAIDRVADDAEEQVTLVARLFSIVTGVAPGPDNSWVSLPVGPLVDAHAESVVDGLRSQATTLKQTLWGLAKPRSANGLLWNGPGTTQFQDAWEEVVAVR